MINALLCLAALGLDPGATPEDMEFTRVQIEQVASWRGVWDLEQALPRRHALLIRQLGCSHGGCRELAAETLAGMGMEAFEALTWGALCRDVATATTSRRLLRACYQCRRCSGEGEIPHKDYGDAVDPWMCTDCQGSGDVRFAGEDMAPRDVFPMRK